MGRAIEELDHLSASPLEKEMHIREFLFFFYCIGLLVILANTVKGLGGFYRREMTGASTVNKEKSGVRLKKIRKGGRVVADV
jgi:hypothetical protein